MTRLAVAVQRGFTLLEAMVVLSLLGIILGVGMPMMSEWTYANKVASAAQFYSEGFVLARNQALTNNSVSRMVLVPADGGQAGWRVDICFPTPDVPCTPESENWSTVDNPAPADPGGATGFKSVLRPANGLPPGAVLEHVVAPVEADEVYFTPLGWVDSTIPNNLSRIELRPTGERAGQAERVAIVLTMAGIANRCKPDVEETHPQRCPP